MYRQVQSSIQFIHGVPPPQKKNESFNHKFISYNLFSDLDLGYAQTLSPESFNKDKGMQLALAEK